MQRQGLLCKKSAEICEIDEANDWLSVCQTAGDRELRGRVYSRRRPLDDAGVEATGERCRRPRFAHRSVCNGQRSDNDYFFPFSSSLR